MNPKVRILHVQQYQSCCTMKNSSWRPNTHLSDRGALDTTERLNFRGFSIARGGRVAFDAVSLSL